MSDDEKKAFEKWAVTAGYDVFWETTEYLYEDTQAAWLGWQAARAGGEPPASFREKLRCQQCGNMEPFHATGCKTEFGKYTHPPAQVPESYVLRKQAEAVERATLICRRDGIRPEVSTASCPVYALNDYAQRLHQQADEAEK